MWLRLGAGAQEERKNTNPASVTCSASSYEVEISLPTLFAQVLHSSVRYFTQNGYFHHSIIPEFSSENHCFSIANKQCNIEHPS